jgi:hypothetical protein
MKRPRRSLRRRAARTALPTAAGVALAAAGLATTAHAQLGPLPAAHLARGQAAQLNISLVAPPDPAMPDPGRVACEAVLGFVDGRGTPIVDRTGVPVEARVALGPGETASLRLPAAAVFASPTALRALFRAQVSFAAPPDPQMPDPCAGAAAAVEVFDTLTGRTDFVLAAPPEPIMPDPAAATQPGDTLPATTEPR